MLSLPDTCFESLTWESYVRFQIYLKDGRPSGVSGVRSVLRMLRSAWDGKGERVRSSKPTGLCILYVFAQMYALKYRWLAGSWQSGHESPGCRQWQRKDLAGGKTSQGGEAQFCLRRAQGGGKTYILRCQQACGNAWGKRKNSWVARMAFCMCSCLSFG